MARISREQKNIKIKALEEAIEVLKEESTPTVNKVTFQNVLDYANEQYSTVLETKIGDKTIKKPTTIEFKKLRKQITDYKEEHKRMRTLVSKKSISETSRLKSNIESLISQVADFYDKKLLLNEQLESKERTIRKLKEERESLYKEVDRLKEKYEY